MNKIFKVIWSKSKQCYVVVSELAKNTTGKKKIVVASILAALVAGQAMQVDAYGKFTGTTDGTGIAISGTSGTPATSTEDNAIAIGQASQATGRGGVALGNKSEAKTSSVAVGYNAKAKANNTVAVGVETNNDPSISNNYSSVSIGIATRARAVGSMAMGVSADASGKYSLALGSGDVSSDYTAETNYPSASGEKSIAIGYKSNASDESAIAIGSASISDKVSATALGRNTTATGVNSSAIGAYSIASDTDATALGRNANAIAAQSTALGTYSVASGKYGTGVGYQANASGSNSTAVGVSAKANKEGASAMGPGARAYGNGAISFGYQALSGANIFNSAGNGSFNDASPDVTSYAKWGDSAIGLRAIASGGNATALGRSATATAANAIAIGGGNGDSATDNTEKTEATGEKSTAIGYNAKAKTGNDLAVGRGVTSSGGAATAVGYYATASGNNAVALGSTINTTAQYATGIGYSVNSQGEGAVAIGAGTDALGAMPAKQVKATAKNAIAIGRATQATSQDATAIGTEATASNTDAIAIGRKSNASGSTSIGFGYNTKATETNTVAIGTDVSATAESAIALGRKTTASGLSSTAVGPLANASGKYSSAFGMSTSAANEGSLALGNGASATVDNGVALGSGSKANVGSGTAGFDPHASRNDPYTNLSGNTLTSTWGAVAVGDGTNTRQIIGVAAGTNDTDAVNVAQLKALNLAFTTDGNAGDVNLTNTLSVNGDTDYIATSGGTGQLTISGKVKDISVDTNGTATASKGLANAANVATAINDANAAQTIKYKANGTGNNSVKLSDGLNFTNGTTTTATVGTNGQVSFDLNTATQKSITDSATAVARTISLGGDTGTTTAKSLSSGNVNFGVKSGNSTYLTTKATGNDVTLTINEQAIKDAAKDASSFKVKANATAAQDVKGGDTVAFNNGDNIAITQNGKTFTIGTSKNVTFDTATIGGNTTIGSTGVTTNKVTVGTISIDGTNGINAGSKAITNVGTGIVANSNADNSNVANIGDVKTIANDAVANLSTNLGVTDGTNNGTVNLKTEKLKVVGTGAAKATVNGQTITVDVAKGTLVANAATGALTGTAGVVDANDMATAVNTAITKAVDNATGNQALKIGGDTAATGSVNLKSDTLSVKGDNKFIKTAASGNDITLSVDEQAIKTAAKDAASFKVKANSGAEQEVKGGETVTFNNGDNIEITQTGKTFTIATAKNVTFDTATIGVNTTIGSTGITTNKVTVGGVSIDGTNGINAGGKQITNVASGGTTATNAANIGDINAAISSLTTNLGKNTTIAYKANNAGGQTVSLADGFDFTNGTLTTAEVAANGVVKFNVTQGSLSTDGNGNITNTAGVATTDDVKTAVNTAITKAVDNATGTQKLDISAGGTDSSVNLKTQKLTVAGTGAATASLNNQTITVDVAQGTFTNKSDGTTSATAGVAKAADVADAINNANTALSKKITDATASVSTLGSNTFTLTADSTSTTGQALNKSGGLSFKVAGDGDLVSTSATTDTVKVAVKKGTLSTNADGTINKATDGVVTADNMTTVVNDAITKAVTSAKDGSAWNISTNGGTATKVSGGNTVDLKGGDNIVIEQDPIDGKKITVKTKKDLTLDSVTAANTVKVGSGTNLITLDGSTGAVSGNTFTAGNASMNTTGFRLTGGPSVTTTGIDAGNKVITNVASGGTTSTNAANIGDITKAISDLTTNLTKNTNIAYTANSNASGQTVSLKDGFNFSNGTLTTAEVAANGVVKFNVTQGALSTDTNGTVSAGTAGVATTADVASAVNSAVSTAVNNATSNQKLDISDGTTDGSVNLKTQKLTVAGTGAATATLNNQTITVNVAEGTFTNNTDGTTTGTAGVAKATDVASAINNANTALSKKITDATASVSTLGSNTFTLIADSTSTTGQALNKSGGLSFKVAGDGDLVSTSATTDTVKVAVKKGTLSTNADGTINKATDGVVTADNMTTVVNDAITKAVTSAKDGSAWNISTNGGTTTKVSGGNTVDLTGEDNIVITQDSTDGKKITVKMKKDLTLDSVTAANTVKVGSGANLITLDGATGGVSGNTFTAGNASMNTTGFRLTGGPSMTTTGIDAGNKVITNVASGGTTATNAANIGDVDNKVTSAINDLTTNLTKNTSISYTANNDTPVKTVSLKDGFKFTDGTLTTAEVAANGVVKFNVTRGSLSTDGNGNITNTAGVATTDDVKNAVNTAINTAVTKATGAQVLNITDGNNNGSINLKNDALKVVGTDGVTTEVSGKTITVGLDTATKDKINNASVATNKNISLAADTGTASSQSLKNGDVSFAVKGATGDYISTNMNGSTVEISTKRATINSNAATGEASVTGNDGLATAKNVADAINAATAKAVSQSAWKLAADGTTGTETISGGDTVNFKAGSNMEVSRTGKDITYKTKDNVAFTTVTAGTGANEVKLDGNTGTVTAKDITATGDVTAKNVTTSGNVTAAGTVKGDTVQGNTVKAGNVTITGGTTNTITGLSNTTWTPAGGIQADRAATEGQLQQAINQVNNTVGNTALTFKGDTNPAQSMTLQSNTFAITGDTMIKTTTNTNGIGLALDTSKVNIAYAANGVNGQTTSLTSGFNFTDGNHTKATVGASGVVKYDAKTSTISVANGHATASGNDLATADNVADAINQMTQNNAGNTTQLRQEISKVATETQRVGAHAAAMAALKPIQYDPLEPTQVMAGVGNYHGETAAALGLAHYTNENTMFNVGVSLGGNHNMVNAGVTHKFGSSPEKKNIPDRYKAGPISSIYVMQDEMTQLRTENESYKAKLDQQQSEIDALKAAVDKLLAAKA